MPIEVTLLLNQPYPITTCPKCGHTPFESRMRGIVQRSKRSFNLFKGFQKRDYCALICNKCNDVVGWESPPKFPPTTELNMDVIQEQLELELMDPNKYPLYIHKVWKYEVNKQKFLEKLKNRNS